MAQSGYTPILLYASGTATNVPLAANLTSSASGAELALNYADGKLFYKDSAGVVQVLASKAGNVNVASFSAGTTGFTPSSATTGAVTLAGTLATTNGGTGLTSFTANGVVYASSTSALTTGSALTFDGTNFATTGAGTFVSATGTAIGLNVRGRSTDNILKIAFTSNSGSTEYGSILGSASELRLNNAASDALTFYTSNAEQMRLTSTGLGIGTSSPSQKLHVVGNALVTPSGGWTTGGVATQYFGDIYGSIKYDYSTTNFLISSYGTFSIATNGTSPTTRLTVDSSGNLGLGVTPSAWSTSFSIKAFQMGGGALYSYNNDRILLGQNIAIISGSDTYINTAAATTYRQYQGAHYWYNAPSGTAGNAISFIQAMTLDANGRLIIGNTAIIGPGKINTYFNGSTEDGIDFKNTNTGNTGAFVAFFNSAGGVAGSITQSSATTVLYNVTSDYRLKENIVDAASASALIDAIQVRQYNWKSDGSHQRYGFIAQELVTVAPEAVHQPADPEAMMAVDYSKLVPMLVKEIQSLRQRLSAANL